MRVRSSRASSTRSSPETLDSYEIGFKSTFGGNLRLNAAIFWNDYTAIQLPTNGLRLGASGSADAMRQPEQRRRCGSLWRRDRSRVAYHGCVRRSMPRTAYLDFEYQAIDPGATAVTLGMITPYTPEDKWSLGAQYEFALGSGGTFTPRIDVSYQGEVYSFAVNAPTNFIDRLHGRQRTLDLAVGWTTCGKSR